MKKIVSIISIFAIIMSLCVTSFANDLAEDEEIRGDFIYEKGTNNILAYVGTSDICEIPENSNLLGLNHIKQTHTAIKKLIINKNVNFSILNSSSSLEEIDFKDGITEIPDGIMQECDSLNKIVFPSTLKKIGNNSFSKCPKIENVDLPNNLEYIGEYVFSGLNSLTGDILIPDTVTHMGYKAFSDCGDLDKVHLSNNLTYTPENKNQETACWFDGTNIKEINIPDKMLDKVSCYFDGDNITFNSDMTVNIYNMVRGSAWCEDKYLKGKTNKTIGNDKDFVIVENTLLRYTGNDKNPKVPEGVKSITQDGFSFCDIDTVTLPQSLEKIEKRAFTCTTLKEITIPKNVDTIESWAFYMCPYMEKVTFEGAPKNIEEYPLDGYYINYDHKENVIFKDPNIKLPENFYSNADEYVLDGFYVLFKEHTGIDLPKVNKKDESVSTAKETLKPTSSVTPTQEPTVTVKPSETTSPIVETSAPTAKPKKLTVETGNAVTVKVDSTDVVFPDAQPFVDENGRTQVPIRAVSEMLDCKVDWDDTSKTATITKENGDVVKVTLGSDVLTVNNKSSQMDTTAIIKDDRTFIPVRFVAEALGWEVEWLE